MKYINLRELYPDVYKTDTLVEVTEEVMAVIQASDRAEAAYSRRMYRHKAQYSLDCKRIYAHFYLGMTPKEIAQAEGVDPGRVRDSIRKGLRKLAKQF